MLLAVAVWGIGLAAFGLAWARLNTLLCDVVTYRLVWRSCAPQVATYLSPMLAVVAVGVLALLRYRSSADHEGAAIESSSGHRSAVSAGLPLVLVVAISAAWLTYSLSPDFVTSCLLAVGMGWAIARLGCGVRLPPACVSVERLAPWILGVAILLATLWNASMQIHLWRHFKLGYADFGFFITELENCLPWKDVPTRFLGTRMGNHCIPLLYLLAPLYAVFRTPMFLMVVGPLALNLAAIPFFNLARRRSGSATTGLIVAVAWLALPSLSWLPYSNSYGFQPVYLAPPLLAAAFVWGLQGRWRLSHVCLVAAMLAQETICGVVLGWGVYLALFGGRRRAGLMIAAGALGYLALATLVVIPAFSEVGAYTRTELFGHLSFNEVLHKVARPRVPLYLLALTAPFLPGLWRGRRILVVALPTLSLILLMENADYLNILYWHHASLLPVLFTAAVIGVVRVEKSHGDLRADSDVARRAGVRSWGPALGMLVTVLLLHHLWGFSPLSQGYRV